VSRRANAIVARAMAKKPQDRHASAHELRQELVALTALATEQERVAALTPEPRRRRRAAVGTLAGLLVLAAVAAVAAVMLGLRPSDPDAGGPPGPDVVAPTRTSPASPARLRLRCWRGTTVKAPQDCPTPSGLRGMLWVYPSFKDDRALCRRIRQPFAPRKVLGYFCPFTSANPREGIRYSEWSSAASARRTISRDFSPWPEQAVEREGYTWSVWIRESRDETGWFSSALAYRDWPFSAEVVSNTPRAARLACNFVELRAPSTFEPVESLCVPGGVAAARAPRPR